MPHRGVVAAPARYRQGTERRESHSHSHSHSIQTGRGSSRHRAVLASPGGVREAQEQIQQQLRRVMAGSGGGYSSSSGHPDRMLPRCSRERGRFQQPPPPRRPQCCSRAGRWPARCTGPRCPRPGPPSRRPARPPASTAASGRRRHPAPGWARLGTHSQHGLRRGRSRHLPQPPSPPDPARRGRPPPSSLPRTVYRPWRSSCPRSNRH